MKISIHIILGIIIILLSFLLYRSIIQPIRFNHDVEIREKDAISRLIDIRKAQLAYRDVYGKYTGSFDTLLYFMKYDSIEIQRKTGSYVQDEMTEAEAIHQGLVKISSTMVSVHDSLFKNEPNIDKLQFVPYTNGQKFVLEAGQIISSSSVKVKVFEVYVLYRILLNGMNSQLVNNYIAEKERVMGFPGLKIGSMTQVTNNNGNWE